MSDASFPALDGRPILIILNNRLTRIAARQHMMQGAFVFDAQWATHTATLMNDAIDL